MENFIYLLGILKLIKLLNINHRKYEIVWYKSKTLVWKGATPSLPTPISRFYGQQIGKDGHDSPE